jgi:hypothetical protein
VFCFIGTSDTSFVKAIEFDLKHVHAIQVSKFGSVCCILYDFIFYWRIVEL